MGQFCPLEGIKYIRLLFLQFVKNYEKENKEKWFFTVAEEAIFGKGWENYAGDRTEIWHKNYPYDVAQIVVGDFFF